MRAKRIIRPTSGRQRKGFTYKSYNFIDKDPIIHEVWDVVKGTSFAYIQEESGVSHTCLYSWFYGKTRKPQSATIRAVLRSVGYDFQIVQIADVSAPEVHNKAAPKMQRLRVIEGGKPGKAWRAKLAKLPKVRARAAG